MRFRIRLAIIAVALALHGVSGCGGGSGGGSQDQGRITRMVSGIVRDSITKLPVPNVDVRVTNASTQEPVGEPTRTDAEGRWVISKITDGDYIFDFGISGGRYRSVQVALTVCGEISNLSVTLLPSEVKPPSAVYISFPPPTVLVGRTAQFTGTATTGGERVTVFWTVQPDSDSPDGRLVGRISADGLFMATSPGVGIVRAQIGEMTAEAEITVRSNNSAGGIFGIVTDAGGRPVGGAKVRIAGREVTSGVDGTFAFADVPPGTYTIVANSGSASGSTAGVTVAVNSVATAQVLVN